MDQRATSTSSFHLLLAVSILALLLPASWAASANTVHQQNKFLKCLSSLPVGNSLTSISKVVYTPTSNSSSYTSILQLSITNLKHLKPDTPKPLAIVTPSQDFHVQAAIICSRKSGLQIRVRSGGHDMEGLSYIAQVPYILIDLINLRTISVDVESKTVWVQGGATLGEVYYSIAQKSRTLGFPAGSCPTVGVGGHISGGGYGTMLRKYGLAGDHVLDARMIDANGRILTRKEMGEDLFWAIRGGGAASFGVVVAWQLELVPVPPTVTVFRPSRTLQQNATKLVHQWQHVASTFHRDLFIRAFLTTVNSTQPGRKPAIQATFSGLFLGGIDRLLPLMQESFPQLGLAKEDCTELSWIESIAVTAGLARGQSLDGLVSRTPFLRAFYKTKSDYLREPIPERVLEGIWERFQAMEASAPFMVLTPYGGRMDDIPENATPFPHRAGNLFQVQYLVLWREEGAAAFERHLVWIRSLYGYMTPYVSKHPRAAYSNYRDLDLGTNNIRGRTGYQQASIWGLKYFKNNFKRLVLVKTMVDPGNFFRNEQSIPSFFD